LNATDRVEQSGACRQIETRDVCASLRQSDRYALTNAAARASDERILTIQAKPFHTEHPVAPYP
jgi:hypothetical protein